MSYRKLRTQLKELRSQVEKERQFIVVTVARGETKELALERMGIDPDDPSVELTFLELWPEEFDL